MLLDELVGAHVAATDPDDKLAVDDLGQDLPRAEEVLAWFQTLEGKGAADLVQVVGEHEKRRRPKPQRRTLFCQTGPGTLQERSRCHLSFLAW